MRLFVGKTCIPCKELKAWLKENDFEIEQLIAEDNMDLASELGVKSLPTLVLDDNTLIKGGDNIREYLTKENNND